MKNTKYNLNIGKWGEDYAAAYLQSIGYEILFRNWREGNREIDLITSKDDRLHIIEVKTRTSTKFGHPEIAVTEQKMRFLQSATEVFMELYPQWTKVQFDVIAITKHSDADISLLMNEDVYF